MIKLEDTFLKLGLSRDNGLYLTKENRWKTETSFPNRVKRLIEQKIEPTAFFCFDNKPMILFFDNPANKAALHEAIWNFNECPIAIIIENSVVEIFNGFSINEDTKLLTSLGGENNLTDFSYFQLVTGSTWEREHYQKEFAFSHRVDYKLLKNIEATQEELAKLLADRKVTNALLGKIIFVRYLIDREVKLNFKGESRPWSNNDFLELLNDSQQTKAFFDYLQDNKRGFNGDLFPIAEVDFGKIPIQAFELLQRLLSNENITTGQKSLFDLYDFSILPIEFISNVYEKFIGKDNQASSGAYYTPTFLVDYILAKTVDKKLNNQTSEYNCRVLDPACGSGIFLVETLRKIIDRYKDVNNIKIDSLEFKEALKQLAIDNVFGVDEDASAIQVAIFSIYLTMLDYLEPAEIENFQFPNLLNTNFFIADFFNETHEFNQRFQFISFDYILGNPPWMRGKGEQQKPLFLQYIEKRRKKENLRNVPECTIGNKEIAQAFLIRSSDFNREKTKCALIVTSKVLYNLKSIDFRKYFLHNYHIERVFELAPVRREVFDKSNKKAISPACVLFYSYASKVSTDSNIIEHIALKPSRFFSLFKIFTINRTDFKQVQQSKLIEFDWLWKVLVYGSYLDFNFIKRLKENYQTIGNLIYQENKFIIKQGIKKKDGNKKIDISELVGWNYIDTGVKSKKLHPYFIIPDLETWKQKEVGYIYRDKNKKIVKAIFSPPTILIKDGLTSGFKTVAALLDKKGVFTDNVTSVKPITSDAESHLENILVLLNSKFNAYWALQTASFVGIKQERSHDEEKFSLPFITINNAKTVSDKVITLKNEYHQAKKNEILSNNPDLIERKIITLLESIDNSVLNKIDVSQQEQTLIDYAFNCTMPLIKGKQKKIEALKYDDSSLKSYANLFLNRFQSSLNNKERKFIVEIWYTNQIIGMFFKLVPASQCTNSIVWENKQDSDLEILSLLTKISSEKVTDKLFVQKDIRGFEKDYFYIFKPNERRLWHKAIGYLDVNEFADAILKAGRKEE